MILDYDNQCCLMVDGVRCASSSAFEIQLQGKPYELTYSCEKHLNDMLEDGENKVYGL